MDEEIKMAKDMKNPETEWKKNWHCIRAMESIAST